MNTAENNGNNGNGSAAPRADSAPIVELPYPVKLILLHMLPHLDELAALWIIQTFGLEKFPGADKAPVKFVERVPQMAPDKIERAGFLCLGLGLGAGRWSIDEHRANVKGRDRLQGECTATLAAKRVGEAADPALKRILDEVYWGDTESGVRYTHLAELVKLMHRLFKGNSAEVAAWLFPALTAIYNQLVVPVSAQVDDPTLSEIFTEYAKRDKLSDERLIAEIEKRLIASIQNIDRSVTELAHVVRSMHRQGVDSECILKFCSKVFEAWKYDQIEFDEAVALVDKAPTKRVLVKVGQDEFALNAIVVRGDSHHLLRAANWRGARLVVIQNSRGQVQVFVNTKVPDFISLDTFVGMIRTLETSPENRPCLSWKKLKTTGAEYVANNWYYFRDARQFFNGSLTHPAVTPTTLHLDAIVDALGHAFHPRLIVKWMRQIGDPMRLFGRSAAPDHRASEAQLKVRVVGKSAAASVHTTVSVLKGAAAGVEADLASALDHPAQMTTTAA